MRPRPCHARFGDDLRNAGVLGYALCRVGAPITRHKNSGVITSNIFSARRFFWVFIHLRDERSCEEGWKNAKDFQAPSICIVHLWSEYHTQTLLNDRGTCFSLSQTLLNGGKTNSIFINSATPFLSCRSVYHCHKLISTHAKHDKYIPRFHQVFVQHLIAISNST